MLESAASIAEVNRLALTVLIDLLERHLRSITEAGLIVQVMKTISKFVMIGRNIRESALYVMAGVFEEMLRLDIVGDDLGPVLSSIGAAMNDADATAVIIQVIARVITPPVWSVVIPWVQRVMPDRSEKWYRKSGRRLISWVLRDCPDTHAEEAVGLILRCIDIPSPKIFHCCAACLAAKLSSHPSGRKAVSIFTRRAIESLALDSSDPQIALASLVAVDFAELLDVPELLDFHRALEPFQKTVAAATRAVLALSLALLERDQLPIDQVKALAHELFDASDEGKRIVVEELMKLADAHFHEIGRSLSVKAASVIVSESEELRTSLARFFTRVSRECLAETQT
jgi:hypothetical protein